MNIYDLHKGESARIIGFDTEALGQPGSDSFKRLIELGFGEGVLVTLRWKDPLPGGPVVVDVRGGQVAIGRSEAQALVVAGERPAREKGKQ